MILSDLPTGQQAAPVEDKGAFGVKMPDNQQAPAEPTPEPPAPAEGAAGASPEPVTPKTPEPPAPGTPFEMDFGIGLQDPEPGAAPAQQGEPPAPQNPPAKDIPGWQAAIKDVPREELLKELGIEQDDEFISGFKKFIKNGGDPYEYLEAKSRDWTKIPDKELVMMDLAAKNPSLTREELQMIFEDEYFQDEDATDREKQLGNTKMKAAADAKRRAEIERQKQFKIPEYQTPAPDVEAVKQQFEQELVEKRAQYVEETNNAYLSNPSTQDMINSKKVTVPAGEYGDFNVGVDPKTVVDYFTNPEVYQKYTCDDKGKVDYAKLQQLALINIIGISKYNQFLIDHGKKMALKSQIEEGQNAARGQKVIPNSNEKPVTKWRST